MFFLSLHLNNRALIFIKRNNFCFRISPGDNTYMYDRHSQRKRRDKSEIGIHAVRGGTIVGEHEIIFAGNHETVSITHSAQSKDLFANGAVNAAIYMNGKKAGLYDMSALI